MNPKPSMHVLLAEDSVPIAQAVAYCLRQAGHSVDVAFDGEAAIERLGEGRADLLILDYSLPKVSGAEVLRQARARPQHLPVLLFSALDDAQSRLAREGLRVDAVLSKPFSLAEFETRVGALLAIADSGAAVPADLAQDEQSVLGLLQADPSGWFQPADVARRLRTAGSPMDAKAAERCLERLRHKLAGQPFEVVKVRGLGYGRIERKP